MMRVRTSYVLALLAGLGLAVTAQAQLATPPAPTAQDEETRLGNGALSRFSAILTQAHAKERTGDLRAAADDFAIAVVSTPNFSQRDSLQQHLRALVQQGAWGGAAAAHADSSTVRAIDRAFQTAYDRQIPVTPIQSPSNGRLVVGEYITAIQCGPCGLHDRAYAALLQRYSASQFIVLAYHDGPGYPIARQPGDSLWSYIAGNAGFSGLYKITSKSGIGDLGWIDGAPRTLQSSDTLVVQSAPSIPAAMYQLLAVEVDRHLQRPPEATLALQVTPSGVSDTSVASLRADIRVTPIVRQRRLGVRLVLVEDTVRVIGLTNRRLQYAAVRTVAWFGHPRQLFFPIPTENGEPTTLSYTFDVSALQQALFATRQSDEDARLDFLDPRAWRIQPRHLGVVAIVQDRDTKEILQAAYQRVFPR